MWMGHHAQFPGPMARGASREFDSRRKKKKTGCRRVVPFWNVDPNVVDEFFWKCLLRRVWKWELMQI
jgi:hypothetical protein